MHAWGQKAAVGGLSWLIACYAALPSNNFLKNPSFEDPLRANESACDQAAHWGRWGHWINREIAWTPTRSGKCLIGYHYWKIHGKDDSGIYQDLKGPRGGKAYTFSIQALRDSGTNADTIELRIEPFGGGPTIASKEYRIRKLKSGQWFTLTVTGMPETDGLRVLVVVTPKRGGTRKGALKFDDAELKETDPLEMMANEK